MGKRRLPPVVAAAVAAVGWLAVLAAPPASAADLAGTARLPFEATAGVPCEAPVVQSFPSVWLGHFSGGYSHYLGEGGPIVLDWRDEKLCFPSDGACKHYIAAQRRDFHRPEGYFTCLPIR